MLVNDVGLDNLVVQERYQIAVARVPHKPKRSLQKVVLANAPLHKLCRRPGTSLQYGLRG